jgi:hypothetical protein
MLDILIALSRLIGGTRVAFDMDDTLLHFSDAFGPVASRVLEAAVERIGPADFDLCKVWSVSRAEMFRVLDSDEWATELYFLEPIGTMVELMQQVKASGLEPVVVTARGDCDVYPGIMPHVIDATRLWLRANGLGDVRIVHSSNKAKVMVEEGGYVALFDDSEKHRLAAIDAGIYAFTPMNGKEVE